MSQTINLNNVDTISYNSKNVNTLNLNSKTIWKAKSWHTVFDQENISANTFLLNENPKIKEFMGVKANRRTRVCVSYWDVVLNIKYGELENLELDALNVFMHASYVSIFAPTTDNQLKFNYSNQPARLCIFKIEQYY